MDQTRNLDVASLLDAVASTLAQNKNQIDSVAKSGNDHGGRMARAWEAAAQAAQNAGGSDAGAQFAAAADAMRKQGRGRAASFYANGLEEAASRFQGRDTLSAADLGTLLQAIAGGAQQGNPAQPGQGSMLDVLGPAADAFSNTQQAGTQDLVGAALRALTSGLSGARGTVPQQSPYGSSPGQMDPGAASATGVIGGIIGALLPGIVGAIAGNLSGGRSGASGSGSPLGGLFGGGQAGNPYVQDQPQGPYSNDPTGGLGGLIGGLLGGLGSGDTTGQGQGANDPFGGLGGLLGGLSGQAGGDQGASPRFSPPSSDETTA